MSQYKKLLLSVLSGAKDQDISFSDLQNTRILERLGFQSRIKGGHFIYTKDGIEEIINIQPKNGKAKPYQVKQIRAIILRYRLGGDVV